MLGQEAAVPLLYRDACQLRTEILDICPFDTRTGFRTLAPPRRTVPSQTRMTTRRAPMRNSFRKVSAEAVAGAAPGVGRRPCERAAATEHRPSAAAHSSRECPPLPFAPSSHPAGQPGDAQGVPPTTATRREATQRQGPAATPEPAPPRYSPPARPRSPTRKPPTPHLAPGACGASWASAGRPWPGAQEAVHGQRPQLRSRHQGLPSQGITVLASCQYPPIARRPGTIPDRTNHRYPEKTLDASAPRWRLTAQDAIELRPQAAAND